MDQEERESSKEKKTAPGERNKKQVYIVGKGIADADGKSKIARKKSSMGRLPVTQYQVDDIVCMKKQHPCGSKEWKILRTGADFKLQCQGCRHEVMISRREFEKHVKRRLEVRL